MIVSLRERTAEHVPIYFERTSDPGILKMMPRKAQTLEEAMADFRKTLLPEATSYGRTIYADGRYVGDIWCYCIDLQEEPNCMLSYCLFDKNCWSKGIASEAVQLFIAEIQQRYLIKTIGAFVFAENKASIRVLEKNGLQVKETFMEDGVESIYLQYGG